MSNEIERDARRFEDAEEWLRDRYGAARAHPEWRTLVEAFNAGRAVLAAADAAQGGEVEEALIAECRRLRQCVKSVFQKFEAAAESHGLRLVCHGEQDQRFELVATHPAPAPADAAQGGEAAGHFIKDFGGEIGRWQQCKGPAEYTTPLYTHPAPKPEAVAGKENGNG